jgi:hypothetical protein
MVRCGVAAVKENQGMEPPATWQQVARLLGFRLLA